MENKGQYGEFTRKVMLGVKKAQAKMIREKIMKGESIVVADANGQITTISAQELAKNK